MIAAIYARKSTRDERTEDKSVDQQVRECRRLAAEQGWTVKDKFVYLDDGVSGGLPPEKRPGIKALLGAVAQQTPPFGVVLAYDQSRLSRETEHAMRVFREIVTESPVKLWLVDGPNSRRALRDEDKMMFGVNAVMTTEYRDAISRAARRALKQKREQGYAIGCPPYGYVNVRVNDHSERRVVAKQAKVVLRIFKMVESGVGLMDIASRLNRDGVPAPRPHGGGIDPLTKTKREPPPRRWRAAGLRDLLRRGIYHDDGGPRIIPESLWQTVQRILDKRAAYAGRGRKGKGTTYDTRGKYLLSGVSVCGHCGSHLIAWARKKADGSLRVVYRCNARHTSKECPKGIAVLPALEAERAVLAELEKLKDPQEVLDQIVQDLATALKAKPEPTVNVARRLQREVDRLTEAVATGDEAVGVLLPRLKAAQARLQEAQARQPAPVTSDATRRLIAALPGLFRQVKLNVKANLLALLDGPIVWHASGKGYRFAGKASPGRLFQGLVGVTYPSAAPAGSSPSACRSSPRAECA